MTNTRTRPRRNFVGTEGNRIQAHGGSLPHEDGTLQPPTSSSAG